MADAPASLEKVRTACKKRGATGIKRLGRAFRIFDDDHSNTLNFDEFKTGLEDYGTGLSEEEAKELFAYFDRDGEGGINVNEFILAFRKPLEGSRKAVVLKAFKKADKTGDGMITCKDLKGVYNCREHPKYKNGEMTEQQVFEEFLNNFEPDKGKDGQVTEKEFLEYYSCLGAGIENDAYFDLMIRNAWKL